MKKLTIGSIAFPGKYVQGRKMSDKSKRHKLWYPEQNKQFLYLKRFESDSAVNHIYSLLLNILYTCPRTPSLTLFLVPLLQTFCFDQSSSYCYTFY